MSNIVLLKEEPQRVKVPVTRE